MNGTIQATDKKKLFPRVCWANSDIEHMGRVAEYAQEMHSCENKEILSLYQDVELRFLQPQMHPIQITVASTYHRSDVNPLIKETISHN